MFFSCNPLQCFCYIHVTLPPNKTITKLTKKKQVCWINPFILHVCVFPSLPFISGWKQEAQHPSTCLQWWFFCHVEHMWASENDSLSLRLPFGTDTKQSQSQADHNATAGLNCWGAGGQKTEPLGSCLLPIPIIQWVQIFCLRTKASGLLFGFIKP